MNIDDIWIDDRLFMLFNQMREELAKRQSSGRGLPVQLGIGFAQTLLRTVNFDLDQKLFTETPIARKKLQKKVSQSIELLKGSSSVM